MTVSVFKRCASAREMFGVVETKFFEVNTIALQSFRIIRINSRSAVILRDLIILSCQSKPLTKLKQNNI